MRHYVIEESRLTHFLFHKTGSSWLWLIARVYLGWQWIEAGWEKVHDAAWTGPAAGAALTGFIQNALTKASGAHPDVQVWYATFLRDVVLAHPAAWSYAVAYGEVLVGAALILGLFTGIAAFFGLFMNFNYLLAGTVSTNPILFVIAIALMLAWKVSGYIGLDRYVLPLFGHHAHSS